MSWLSKRSRDLAASGGRAAKVWEDVNALASRPGIINMGQGFPDFAGSSVARDAAAQAIRSCKYHTLRDYARTRYILQRLAVCKFPLCI